MRYAGRYRSFFWPGLLILAGLIALLVNTGAIPVDRLYELINLWPLILIVIGLELIVRRSLHGASGDVAAALIVLLAVAGAAGYVAASPNPSATHTLDTAGPVGSLDRASLEVDVGAAQISMTGSADIGSDLYRAHVEYSGAKPAVDFNQSTGKLRISQSSALFQPGSFNLSLTMNTSIKWTVTEDSGATRDTIDFSRVHVRSLTLDTGASRDDITLGPASGTVPVEINGGALTVHVHRPTGVPASIAISGGAVSLDADGRSSHAVGDLTYASPDFSGAADRYQIKVDGGACTVTLDAQQPSA